MNFVKSLAVYQMVVAYTKTVSKPDLPIVRIVPLPAIRMSLEADWWCTGPRPAVIEICGNIHE
jgi:hypothetical protein